MADPQPNRGKLLLNWAFPEFEQRERSLTWYFLAVPLALALLVWALVTQSYLFAVIILIASIILVRQHVEKPRHLSIRIFEDGIEVAGANFYEFREIRNFWIVYEPPTVKRVFFNFRAGLRPDLIVPMEDQNPLAVRQVLRTYLAEDLEREGEPTAEAIARFLKL